MDAVEDAVDEAARLTGPELLGDLDGLVDDDLGRGVGAPAELVDREAQDVAVDDRHAVEVPVFGEAGDGLVDARSRRHRPAYELVGKLARLAVEGMKAPELVGLGRGIGLTLQVQLIQKLQGDLPGFAPPTARATHRRFRAASRGLAGRRRPARAAARDVPTNSAISSAASAASAPRLPTAPPARAHACS